MVHRDAVCVCGHAIEDHIVTGKEETGYGQGRCLKPGCPCNKFKSLEESEDFDREEFEVTLVVSEQNEDMARSAVEFMLERFRMTFPEEAAYLKLKGEGE